MEGHDKEAVLSAVRTYLGGHLTEQDFQLLLDRRARSTPSTDCFTTRTSYKRRRSG